MKKTLLPLLALFAALPCAEAAEAAEPASVTPAVTTSKTSVTPAVTPSKTSVTPAVTPSKTSVKPKMEIVFVLDSTGSMGSLIDGAKQKIWTIANAAIMRKPAPEIRVGLIAYRDKGDAYITKQWDLSDDFDAVFRDLQTIQASGGGDSPESVNQALAEAIGKISWSKNPNVMKTVFLVGDCPPHMDYQDDVKYPETCRLAKEKGIVVNAILCGNDGEGQKHWLNIAQLGGGDFVRIAQTGGVQAVATPFDKDIAAISAKLEATVVVYGSATEQEHIRNNLADAKKLNFSAIEEDAAPAVMEKAAERAVFNRRQNKAVQGKNDLISSDVQVETIKDGELPEVMKKMTVEERKKYVEEKKKERAELNRQLAELDKKREEFRQKELIRLARESKGDGFDLKVSGMINKQADATFNKSK